MIPLSMQHVLLFLASIIAVPLMIGNSIGFTDLRYSTIGTVRNTGFWNRYNITMFWTWAIGNRLPIILGSTFIFVTPCIVISQTLRFPGLFGASLICAIICAFIGVKCIKYIKNCFRQLLWAV